MRAFHFEGRKSEGVKKKEARACNRISARRGRAAAEGLSKSFCLFLCPFQFSRSVLLASFHIDSAIQSFLQSFVCLDEHACKYISFNVMSVQPSFLNLSSV